MYTLDTRETNILRHALGQDGSPAAMDLLDVLPSNRGDAGESLSPRQAEIAAEALETYAGRNENFGGLASNLAKGLRQAMPRLRA